MPERDGYIPGVPCWVDTSQPDPEAALGFGLREQVAQMGAPEGFIDVVAALSPIPDHDRGTPAHWEVTFAVDDADATASKAASLGGEVVAGPFDAPWTRLAVIRDPQGATFVASQFVPENKDIGT